MKTAARSATVDFRLLGLLSDLVICSRCLRAGRVTPVPQVVSPRHKLRSLCSGCAKLSRAAARNTLATLKRL